MSLHTGMPSAHVSSDHSGPGSKPQSARGGAAQVFLGREVAIPKGSNREPDVGTNLGRGGTSGQEPVSCHRTYTSSVRTGVTSRAAPTASPMANSVYVH